MKYFLPDFNLLLKYRYENNSDKNMPEYNYGITLERIPKLFTSPNPF